jgi:hypothetical protein
MSDLVFENWDCPIMSFHDFAQLPPRASINATPEPTRNPDALAF